MQVDRYAQRLGAGIDRPIFLCVAEFSIGQPMDHRAPEAEIFYTAFQLVRRRFRMRGGKCCKGGEPVRIGRDSGVQVVIRLAGNAGTGFDIEALGRRCTMAEDLNVDPGVIHFLQPQFADIVEPVEQLPSARCIAPDERVSNDLVPVMLFESDDFDPGGCRHGFCS